MIAVGLIGMLAALAMLVWNALRLATALVPTRTAVAEIPLGPNSFPETLTRWKEHGISLAGQVTMPLAVENAPEEVLQGLSVGRSLGAVSYILVGALVFTLSAMLLVGRLQWRWLAPSAITIGILILAGEIASQLIVKSATTELSQFVQRDLDSWYEPTFGVGTDPLLPLLGLTVTSVAVVFALASRYARDADGVV